MKIKRHQLVIAALIILGVTFLVIGVFHQKEPIKYFAYSLRTWQEADSVAGYPIPTAYDEDGSPTEFKTTKFQPNLSTMSPMELYRLPTARGFTESNSDDAQAAGTGLVLSREIQMATTERPFFLATAFPTNRLYKLSIPALQKST